MKSCTQAGCYVDEQIIDIEGRSEIVNHRKGVWEQHWLPLQMLCYSVIAFSHRYSSTASR